MAYRGPENHFGEHKALPFNSLLQGDHPLYNGLQGFWPLCDRGVGIVNDYSAHNRYGGATNLAAAVTTKFKNASTVTNSSTNVTIARPEITRIMNTADACTASIWLRTSFSPGAARYGVFYWGNDVDLLENFGFFYNQDASNISVFFQGDVVNGSNTWNDGFWHQFLFTFGGGTCNLYFDNVLDASAGLTIGGSGADVYIGHHSGGNSVTGQYFGAALWNRVLTAAERYEWFVNPYVLMKEPLRDAARAKGSSSRVPDLMPLFFGW